MRNLFFLAFCLALTAPAFAMNTELGINYSYKKSAFDTDNNNEQQGATGSISLYFWERIALELSYTNSLYVKKEKQPDRAGAFLRTTTQYSDVYGADLIFILSADRKAVFQPYIKAGAAQVKVRQVVQDTGAEAWEINYSGLSPSAGVGFKFFLTDAFAVRTSYDAIQTPVNNETKVTDVTGRVGVSWMF
jgi:hypothetical protein